MSDIAPRGVCPLEHLGVIHARGEDAAKFLHGQLTNDTVLLPDGQARLAAYCNPKGRMLASFLVIRRSAEDILLICSRDLLTTVLKRLTMFVMRAKVSMCDATADFTLLGILGNLPPEGAVEGMEPWKVTAGEDSCFVNLYPSNENSRQLWVGTSSAVNRPVGPQLSTEQWMWSDVASGVPTVSAATAEMFVPQMLNYESIGGVSFKKGCYPGQEVVARSQFRGSLKRRTFLSRTPTKLEPGQEIFSGDETDQPVGVVVQAADRPDPDKACLALLCLQISADLSNLRVQGATDDVIEIIELPYPLLKDV